MPQGYFLTVSSTFDPGDWLTDEHITFAQDALRKQHAGIQGLRNPVLFEAPHHTLEMIPVGKFLQTFHVNSNHWVCVTSIGPEMS